MANRLSVCLLTWNEAANVGRALQSVAGVADEVVVVDTGSTDGTLALAQSLGAKVVPHSWSENFSDARNAALDQATGDWVLWLNPDEELEPSSVDRLRALVRDDSEAGEKAFGYLARVRSQPKEDRPELFGESWDLRIFRRVAGARYVGRVHPSFPKAFAESLAAEGRGVAPSDVMIRQHSYLATATPAKLRWGARILEKELADRPGQLPFLVEYAQTLLSLGDPKGHDVMAEAAGQVAAAVDSSEPPGPAAQRVLEYLLTVDPARSKATLTADQAEMLALRWFASSPPLLWTVAGRYFQARRIVPATVLLERLLELGRTEAYDRSTPFDPRLIGPWPMMNLGQCYGILGRTEQAKRLLVPLLTDPEYQPRAAEILTAIERPPGAS